jgi:hypothetical protein
MKITFLRRSEISISIPMGTSPIAILQSVETIFDSDDNSFLAITRGSSVALCISFVAHCNCRSGPGEGGRRGQKVNASILCF